MHPFIVALICLVLSGALITYEVRRLARKDRGGHYRAVAIDPCGSRVLDPKAEAMYVCRRPMDHPPEHDDGRGHTWADA